MQKNRLAIFICLWIYDVFNIGIMAECSAT